MRQQFILWGVVLVAFAVTLSVSWWHEGLWHTTAPTAQDVENAQRTRTLLSASATPVVSARPFAPATTTTDASAAAQPPAGIAESFAPPTPTLANTPEPGTPDELPPTQSEAQTEPSTLPEVDHGEMLDQWDRAARRGARSH